MKFLKVILVALGIFVVFSIITIGYFEFVSLPEYSLEVNTTMNDSLFINEVGSGKPVLFVHGLGSSSTCWDEQVSRLPEKFKLITIDLYGHGQNKNLPQNISISQTAEKIAEQLRNRNMKNISLVGHSLGGLIVLELTKQNQDLVDKIILVDTPTKQTGLSIMNYLFLKLIESNYETVVKEHYKKMTEDEDLLESLLAAALNTDKYAYYSYMKSVFNVDYSSMVGNLKANTYVFLSTSLVKDKSKLSKIKSKYGYKNITEGHVFYYDDSGHFIMLEKSKRFTNDLLNILSQ